MRESKSDHPDDDATSLKARIAGALAFGLVWMVIVPAIIIAFTWVCHGVKEAVREAVRAAFRVTRA